MTTSQPDTEAPNRESFPAQDEAAAPVHNHPYPQLDALMVRLQEDDPARMEYEALLNERESLFEQIEWRAGEARLRRAVSFAQSSQATPAPDDRNQRVIHLLLLAFADDLTKDGWLRVGAILSACATDPTAQLEALPELISNAPEPLAGDPLAVDNQWTAPQLAEATLLTFKRRYPRHISPRASPISSPGFAKTTRQARTPTRPS